MQIGVYITDKFAW